MNMIFFLLVKLLTRYHFLTFIRGPLVLCSHLMWLPYQTENMVIGVGLDQQREADKRDCAFYLETTARQYHQVHSLEINTLPLI